MMRLLSLRVRAVFFIAALTIFALVAPQPAQALILNNGMIVVHNHTGHPLSFSLSLSKFGNAIFHVNIPTGGTYRTQNCCYAAGTLYWMYIATDASRPNGTQAIRPHLCYRNGIPYGYAVVNVNIAKNEVKTYTEASEIDHNACYEGPL